MHVYIRFGEFSALENVGDAFDVKVHVEVKFESFTLHAWLLM